MDRVGCAIQFVHLYPAGSTPCHAGNDPGLLLYTMVSTSNQQNFGGVNFGEGESMATRNGSLGRIQVEGKEKNGG